MESASYLKWLWSLWLALPTTALSWWLCWASLPARIPMKYNAAGLPTAWATPYQTMVFTFELLGFVLLVVTGVGYLVLYQRPERSRLVLLVFYLTVGLLGSALNGFIWSQRV